MLASIAVCRLACSHPLLWYHLKTMNEILRFFHLNNWHRVIVVIRQNKVCCASWQAFIVRQLACVHVCQPTYVYRVFLYPPAKVDSWSFVVQARVQVDTLEQAENIEKKRVHTYKCATKTSG